MFTSMTGFGRAMGSSSLGKLVVEIQSLNRKYLEILIALPKELSRFETELRKWVNDSIGRGQVTLRVFLLPDTKGGGLPSEDLLSHQRKAWVKLAQSIGCDARDVSLSFLLERLPPQIEFDEKDLLRSLEKCVKEALKGLIKMKQQEGKVLEREIHGHLQEFIKLIDAIQKRVPKARSAAQVKLTDQIREAMQQKELDERILQAIISFTDRSDISEELARLHSHCLQFQTIQQGRTLDFLIQEMGREVNTIGSKAADLSIAQSIVGCKSTLEKIREQIQNIE